MPPVIIDSSIKEQVDVLPTRITKATKVVEKLTISKPKLAVATFDLTGISAYVQLRFSQKARESFRNSMLLGEAGKKNIPKREARNFDQEFLDAMYEFHDGSRGIPASAFRNACIDACRMANFQMTKAKMSIFIEEDGQDKLEPIPLVKITTGTPVKFEAVVRNDSGVIDIRTRALWNKPWGCVLKVTFDTTQFVLEDVFNLLLRAGQQVGVGEGRPFSKDSCGCGWGRFSVAMHRD